jgi:hypothetical protein
MKHINAYLTVQNRAARHPCNRIRTIKNGDWYWISKKILNIYGQDIRASGIAVYSVLASLANSTTQACFPTHRTIAEIAGLSKRTVSRRIRQLEKIGLIRQERQKRGSICYLLEIQELPPCHLTGDKSDPR